MVDWVLDPVSDIARAYFDDIISGTFREGAETEEDLILKHYNDLRKVFLLLKKDRWVLDFKKCALFVHKVEFCCHVLENRTRKISPGRFLAMEKWPIPTTVTSLRAFLGFVNHFHQYIPEYAELAASLQDKLKLPRLLGKKDPHTQLNFLNRN